MLTVDSIVHSPSFESIPHDCELTMNTCRRTGESPRTDDHWRDSHLEPVDTFVELEMAAVRSACCEQKASLIEAETDGTDEIVL